MDPDIVKRAQLTAALATSAESLRRCQAVLLPALSGATLEQTATALGVGRATVARLQVAFRKQRPGLPALRNWGGRRQPEHWLRALEAHPPTVGPEEAEVIRWDTEVR